MTLLFSSRLILVSLMALSLAACASTGTTPSGNDSYDAKINAALERAADQARRDGSTAGSLALMEKLYKRDPKNADNALKFARALRAAGDDQKAALVLDPFAARGEAGADTLTEMATLELSASKYPQAESLARRAVEKDAKAFRAYQILGIALDAQNKYKPAEAAFRSALDLWEGDPIPVMNNLALNLTNQERLTEALEIMERAKEAAPNRVEVERNLRIIRTLNESASGRPAPKPTDKPTVKPVLQPDQEPAAAAVENKGSTIKPVEKAPLADQTAAQKPVSKIITKKVSTTAKTGVTASSVKPAEKIGTAPSAPALPEPKSEKK